MRVLTPQAIVSCKLLTTRIRERVGNCSKAQRVCGHIFGVSMALRVCWLKLEALEVSAYYRLQDYSEE